MLTNKLQGISKQMIERYSNRYSQFGYDIKTLGWGTIEQQHYRFLMTLSADIDFANKTIVDIGCGFGDYYSFFKNKKIGISSYTGIDINPDLICEARKMSGQESKVNFEVGNLLEMELAEIGNFDISIMLGLLNLNLKGKIDNYQYSKKMIENAFNITGKLLVVDFISTRLTDTYPKEDFIFYHEPVKMMEYALSLSDNVVLKHNYSPIPQKEFMLFIYKE